MGSVPHEPEPGELVGYLICYGERVKCWTAVIGDEARADLVAVQLHGRKFPLVVGNHLDELKPMDRSE